MPTKKTSSSKTKKAVPVKKAKRTITIKQTKKVAVAVKAAKKVTKKKTGKTKTVASAKAHKISLQNKPHKRRLSPKRVLYMFFSMTLGLLMGMIVYSFVEMIQLRNIAQSEISPAFYEGGGTFSQPVILAFLFAGLLLGIRLGIWGWRTVYIEHRHRMFKKK